MTLTIEVPEHLEAKLVADASRQGRSLPDHVLDLLERSMEAQEPSATPTAHPVLHLAEQIRESVPTEKWAELPADLSVNVDHYLYGHPKENR